MPELETRLRARRPRSFPARRRAGVAVVLRFVDGNPEVLLMQRATSEFDRWSGQVSLPGGGARPSDPSLEAAAVRETREEVGLELERHARLLGRLDDRLAFTRGSILPMSIRPFVFVQTVDEPTVLGPEAAATFWLPLDLLVSGSLDQPFAHRVGPFRLSLPSWRYQTYTIWGLTHTMLSGLVTIASTDNLPQR